MPLFGEIVVIKRNGSDGTHFPLTATTCLFGRKAECDIRIQLPHVSKEHCKVEVKQNKEVIATNLSTVNPAQLNGKAIQQPVRLKHGDVLTIIDRSFRFEETGIKPVRRRSTSLGSNQVSSNEQSSNIDETMKLDNSKGNKGLRKSEGMISKTTHTRRSLQITSSVDRKDMSPFSELYEMFKSKVESKKSKSSVSSRRNSRNQATDTRGQAPSVGQEVHEDIRSEGISGSSKSPSRVRRSSLVRQNKDQETNVLKSDGQEHVKTPRRSSSKASSVSESPRSQTSDHNGTLVHYDEFISLIGGEKTVVNHAFSPDKKKSGLGSPRQRKSKGSVPEQCGTDIVAGFPERSDKSRTQSPRTSPRERKAGLAFTKSPVTQNHTSAARIPDVSPQSRRSSRTPVKDASPKALESKPEMTAIGTKKSPRKRRSDELALPEPPMKRKRVSFGGHLSPELFDKRLPPNSPLKRGATPARRSLSISTPRAVIRKSFGLKQSVIKESNEQPLQQSPVKLTPAKTSPARKSPVKLTPAKTSPARKSPVKLTPAKTSPARKSPVKLTPAKTSPARKSPVKLTPAKTSPARKSPVKLTPAKTSPARKSPVKLTPAKTSPARKSPVKLTPAKTSPARKSPVKLTPAKTSPARKSPAKLTPAKTSPARKSPAKTSPARKSPAKTSPARKSPAKLTPAKTSPARKSPAKLTPAKTSPARKSPAKLTPAKTSPARKSPAKLTPAKTSPARKSPAKLTPAKTSPARKSPAKLTPAKTSPARKSPAKLTPAKTSPARKSPSKLTPAKTSPARKSPAKLTPAKTSPARKSPAKRTPAKLTPARRTPAKLTPARRTPAKLTPARRTPAKTTPARRTPAKTTPVRRSPAMQTPDVPYTKGRFSISRINTPPLVAEPASSSYPAHGLHASQTPKKSRKSFILKKTPLRRSRKLDALEVIRSRRKSGATEANLKFAKSWADVVKIGVAKPQKKKVKAGCKVNIIKKKKAKTPARKVKEQTSTGHADSPATILIGRAHTRSVNLIGHVPKIVRNLAVKINRDPGESFTGLTELFSTPVSEKQRKSDRVHGSNSLMRTPEESGEMVVSPIDSSLTTQRKKYSQEAVSRLLTSPVSPELLKVNEQISDAPVVIEAVEDRSSKGIRSKTLREKRKTDLTGIKRLLKTPKEKGKPVTDPVALKKLLRTPKQVESQAVISTRRSSKLHHLDGIQHLLKTPKQKGVPLEDMTGIKRIMQTPKQKGEPVEDHTGIKRIMRTPRQKGEQVEDMVGIKRIMTTPKEKGQPVEDMVGISRIMATPTENTHPIEEFFGIKQLIKTPPKKSTVNEEVLTSVDRLHTEKNASTKSTEPTSVSTPTRSGKGRSSKRLSLSGVSISAAELMQATPKAQPSPKSERTTPKSSQVQGTTPQSGSAAGKATPKRGRLSRSNLSDLTTSDVEETPEESSQNIVLVSTSLTPVPEPRTLISPKRKGRPSRSATNLSVSTEETSEESSQNIVLVTTSLTPVKEPSTLIVSPRGRGRPSRSATNISVSIEAAAMKSRSSPSKRKGVEGKSSQRQQNLGQEHKVDDLVEVQPIKEPVSVSEADKQISSRRKGRPPKSSTKALHEPVSSKDFTQDVLADSSVSFSSRSSNRKATRSQKIIQDSKPAEESLPNAHESSTKHVKKYALKKSQIPANELEEADIIYPSLKQVVQTQGRKRNMPHTSDSEELAETARSNLIEESIKPSTETLSPVGKTVVRRGGRSKKNVEGTSEPSLGLEEPHTGRGVLSKHSNQSTSAISEMEPVKEQHVQASELKAPTRSLRHQKIPSTNSTETQGKTLRGRQTKITKKDTDHSETPSLEKPEKITQSLRRGRKPKVQNTVSASEVESNKNSQSSELSNSVIIVHDEQESEQGILISKNVRGRRKNQNVEEHTSLVVVEEHESKTAETVLEKETLSKRSTRGKIVLSQGKVLHGEIIEVRGRPSTRTKAILQPLDVKTAPKGIHPNNKSVQWDPLLTSLITAQENQDTTQNFAKETSSGGKSKVKNTRKVEEPSIPAKRPRRGRIEENTNQNVIVNIAETDLLTKTKESPAKTNTGKRGTNRNTKLKEINVTSTEPEVHVFVTTVPLEETAKDGKALKGKRNPSKKTSSDVIQSESSTEPNVSLESKVSNRRGGRRAAVPSLLDSEVAEKSASNKRVRRPASQAPHDVANKSPNEKPLKKGTLTIENKAAEDIKLRRGVKRKITIAESLNENLNASTNESSSNKSKMDNVLPGRSKRNKKTPSEENEEENISNVVSQSPAEKVTIATRKSGKSIKASKTENKTTKVIPTRASARTRK
ncbi:proliferation marker protein Ki-67 [Pelodytes ibericus]